MPRKFMTTLELADYLTAAGVQTSARTIEDWRHKGTGPDFVRIQGRVRYRPATVRQWLGSGERKSTGAAA